jgi:hypothetical protein
MDGVRQRKIVQIALAGCPEKGIAVVTPVLNEVFYDHVVELAIAASAVERDGQISSP